jgi:hypothetical protein
MGSDSIKSIESDPIDFLHFQNSRKAPSFRELLAYSHNGCEIMTKFKRTIIGSHITLRLRAVSRLQSEIVVCNWPCHTNAFEYGPKQRNTITVLILPKLRGGFILQEI